MSTTETFKLSVPARCSKVHLVQFQKTICKCTRSDFKVLEVPGHTLDHVAFTSTSELFETPVAFTGDTMFAAGCGRLFEGTADDMFRSLKKINDLPDNTLVYCAHEYTLANLEYAVHAEPKNLDTLDR